MEIERFEKALRDACEDARKEVRTEDDQSGTVRAVVVLLAGRQAIVGLSDRAAISSPARIELEPGDSLQLSPAAPRPDSNEETARRVRETSRELEQLLAGGPAAPDQRTPPASFSEIRRVPAGAPVERGGSADWLDPSKSARAMTEKIFLSSDERDALLREGGEPDSSARAQEPTQRSAPPGLGLDALRACKLFWHMTVRELELLAQICRGRRLAAGEVMVEAGALIETLTVVHQGCLEARDADGSVRQLKVHDHFAFDSLIDHTSSPEKVTALEESLVVSWSRPDLMGLLRREPTLAVKLLWAFAQESADLLRQARARPGPR